MKKISTLIILFSLLSFGAYTQDNQVVEPDSTENYKPSTAIDSVERTPPTLAIGVGTLSYFGELNNSISSPSVANLAYHLSFRQKINYFLEFEITAIGGRISANERSIERNLNFESTIFGGGFGLNYNFGNFLKNDRILEPIIGVGVEFLSFNSKTDLKNDAGVRYHYWEDGSIKNLPEDSPNSDNAVRIDRDYYYETDIENSAQYNLDQYNAYTIAFPITVGANMLINDKWTFRAAATYHFTLTDMIDGVSANNGNYKGDSQNDNLLYTSLSISYNFTKNEEQEDAYDEFIDIDMLADEDQDSIIDWEDHCLGTPLYAEVDEFGCPLDGDDDGVPNYGDDELDSAPGAQVDSLGVTITDADANMFYARFYDTLGTYSEMTAELYTMQIIASKVRRKGNVNTTKYSVAIGEFEGEIPSDLVNDILSVQDVNTYDSNGKIVVAVGSYETKKEAEDRQVELVNDGITPTDIIKVNGEKIQTETGVTSSFAAEQWEGNGEEGKVVYRVQVGAFNKAANEEIFKELPKLIKVTSDDGYVRYFTGSYGSYTEAANAKIDILVNGFNGAFVVAFRGGNRVSLQNVGNTKLSKSEKSSMKSSSALTEDQKNNLKFKVQIGSYKKQIPTDVLEKYMELGNVDLLKGSDQYIRYVAGSFDAYDEATAYKTELIGKGFEGSYVIGVYYGKIISASQAKKMLNK